MLSYQRGSATSLLLGGSGGSLFSGFFESGFGLNTSPEIEWGARIADTTDSALFSQFFDDGARDGAIHFVLLRESGASDDEDFGDLLCHLLPALLVEEDIEVKLILYLDLGPWLFLCFCLASFLQGIDLLADCSLSFILTFSVFTALLVSLGCLNTNSGQMRLKDLEMRQRIFARNKRAWVKVWKLTIRTTI